METIKHYPRFFDKSDCVVIRSEISSNGVLEVLKCFGKDKSPGPNGWSVEFFLHFFYLMSDEI